MMMDVRPLVLLKWCVMKVKVLWCVIEIRDIKKSKIAILFWSYSIYSHMAKMLDIIDSALKEVCIPSFKPYLHCAQTTCIFYISRNAENAENQFLPYCISHFKKSVKCMKPYLSDTLHAHPCFLYSFAAGRNHSLKWFPSSANIEGLDFCSCSKGCLWLWWHCLELLSIILPCVQYVPSF